MFWKCIPLYGAPTEIQLDAEKNATKISTFQIRQKQTKALDKKEVLVDFSLKYMPPFLIPRGRMC